MLSDFWSLFTEGGAYHLNLVNWALAGFSAFVVGLSKSGIKGVGIVSVTIMALLFGSKASTGLLIPILIAADIFAVIYYNRHAQWKTLGKLMPWMILGVLLGVWIGKDLPEDVFKFGMAIIILTSVFIMLWWENKKEKKIPDNTWFAGLMGGMAGFTTMVGNLAGAFANIYFLAMRFPKSAFIGTAAWLFFMINVFKLPFHIWVWETVSTDSFRLNILLFPAMIIGFFVGVKVVDKIKDQSYRKMILWLTAIGAIAIFFR